MIAIILLGLLAMSTCLILQAGILIFAVRYFAWNAKRQRGATMPLVQISMLMIALMLGNIIQIAIWALIYRALGGFEDFETAVYFSGVTFTTLGYGDVVLHGRIRFLAPLQAANGVMMFGLSTAALLAVVQKGLGKWATEHHYNARNEP